MSDAWMAENDGPKWMPTFALVEAHYGIPTHLLARIGFQESSFRPDVISGAVRGTSGDIGIMQLLPEYFPTAGIDPAADIDTAGRLLKSQFNRFGDWQESVAAYNWGGGNLHHSYMVHGSYALADLPALTQRYVTQVFTDIGVPGALVSNV